MFQITSFSRSIAARGNLAQRTRALQRPITSSAPRQHSTAMDVASSDVPTASNGERKLYAPYIVKEVLPPQGGSPIYWSLRRSIFRAKTDLMLIARQFRLNTCIVKAAFGGVPKHSYDPKMNQWVKLMDNEEWGGLGGRLWISLSNNIMFNFFLAFVLYTLYFRFITNNKHNVFARWATAKDEEDD